ncbi:MAG TPA: DNA alkylation repair protein, partial [Anaerolineales bacterium]
MPAIDLARLRKQATRLADFFYVPEEFLVHLHEMLDSYVDHTLRKAEGAAPGSNLSTYRTPPMILRQIEQELNAPASEYPSAALDLADLLWDQGYLETRLLAAFLLGRIPPQEERLLARLTAWTQQVRDPNVRSALLTTSLTRLRIETPDEFLELIREWSHPARPRTWSNGLQALLPMISSPDFQNLPPVLDVIEPIVEAAPAAQQLD